nr:uncharacterized protein LOC124068277 isoform X2 [Scatophagus argus]
MLLLLSWLVSFCLFGSSVGAAFEEICYGRDFRLPYDYTPPLYNGKLYFTPSKGGPRKLMMDNGEAKDPRMKVSYSTVRLKDLRESDDGTFSVMFGTRMYDFLKLKILDCAEEVTRYYGHLYSYSVPREAEFLEFIPLHSVDQLMVLWNLTDSQTNKGARRQMKRNSWEISGVTQADAGYYNLRKKDNTLLSRVLLRVEESRRHYDTKVNTRLFIQKPFVDVPWTVTFTREGETEQIPLMKDGKPFKESSWNLEASFRRRISFLHDSIEIAPVQIRDSGTFEFRDPQGNLAESAEVLVEPEFTPTWVYAAISGGIIFAVIFCCCCIRKCCCGKSSSKRDESAAAVYHHDENRPTGPTSYSAALASHYSYRPVNSLASREPATASLGPPVYNPVNIHVNPTQPEVAAPGGQGVTPAPSGSFDLSSSDPDPRFELKGLAFPSAPPLSSDSTFCDVYSSDKLNFL